MMSLSELVAEELAQPVDPKVTAMAAALAAQYPKAARAVLFYGSCLRQRELDGLMLDFYLIVSDYRDAYESAWLVFANKAIPPNVFPFEHDGLIAKYAVLSEADFARECGIEAGSVSVWARFAQPSRLVWAESDAARARVIDSISHCAPTLFALTLSTMAAGQGDPLAVFRAGFALTYGAELRAERLGRSESIVDTDADYYERIGRAAFAGPLPDAGGKAEVAAWRRRQFKGKALTLVRLAKATTTFAGGVDYIAWKINRHAGAGIEVKPWQRRWPILGALTLLPRLWRRGAIR